MIFGFDFQRYEVSFSFLLSHPTALSCIRSADHALHYKESERAVAERSDQPEGRPPATAAGEAAEENGQGHENVIPCPPLNPK